MVGGQDTLYREAPFEVVPGKDELRRLASRQDTAMVQSAHAAKNRQIPTFGETLGHQMVEEARPQMGSKRQDQDREFFRDRLCNPEKTR